MKNRYHFPVCIIPACFILMTVIVFLSPVSCGTAANKQQELWGKTGWIDGDTYRVKASGTADRKKWKNENSARDEAKRIAVYEARRKIINELGSGKIESSNIAASLMNEFLKEIEPSIRGGRIVAERYIDSFTCEIVFEIRKEGLKKRYDSF